MDSTRMRKLCHQNNISIKQSRLDTKTALIDKESAFGNFLPSVNASHSWNIGLNQDITTGLLQNQTTQFTSAGVNVELIFIKDCKIKIRCAERISL
jgi:outer membrane protein